MDMGVDMVSPALPSRTRELRDLVIMTIAFGDGSCTPASNMIEPLAEDALTSPPGRAGRALWGSAASRVRLAPTPRGRAAQCAATI